jgi:ferritin
MIGKKRKRDKQTVKPNFIRISVLSMAAYSRMSICGFANWKRVQRRGVAHAMKLFDHVVSRSGRMVMAAIDGPETEWKSPLAAFQAALDHEIKVTGMINDLVDIAIAEKDHAANAMLQWFVTEQVEEEMNAGGLVKRLERAGNSPNALLMLDRELSGRTFVMPSTGEED